ncbi:MAG: ABC transporter substrate-binding protein [Bacillales bacterium]|nr:ABC transporter substrate-binding protein [Bacillales bacterium]
MRKYLFLIIILFLFIVAGFFIFNKKEESDLKKVKVAEVAHSIFYAPQYVAHKLGYFEEEGLDVEIILTSGADKVTSAVLSGDVNIGFCGSEATIYVYNEGEKDYLINFAALTKRDGSFLVSREKYDNFTLGDLKGKKIIGGRKGGMPEMTLEWALKQNGIDPKSDVKIDTSIAFAAMSGAFIGGEGDFVSLFEPNALEIEKNGYGYVVASIGKLGGVVPYTAYNARKSYILENPDVIEGFTRAIQKGLDYVHNNDSREIAKLLEDYFPNTSIDDLEKLVQRHKDIDSWFNSTSISEKDFNHIQEIMISAGELKSKVDYKILVK